MGQTERRITFTKMQGVGNDFVVVDEREGAPLENPDAARLATAICDRRFGVGADGLLLISQPSAGTDADAAMRMFNPDGTPDFCGNGLRCVGLYLAEHPTKDDSEGPPYRVETRSGVRTVDLAGDCHTTVIDVDMGSPRFAPADIPMLVAGERVVDYPLQVAGETVLVTALSTGTAHTVVFGDTLPDGARFHTLSAAISDHPLFPERTSVMWATVESRDRIRLRIWERGAGETLGCGTGACAAAVAARIHGWTGERVVVASRGGELAIAWSPGGAIEMAGPARYVHYGVYLWPDGTERQGAVV